MIFFKLKNKTYLFFKIYIICLNLFFTLIASGLCVKTYEANLRKAPSSKAEVTWKVNRFTPLVEVSRKGGWFEVEDQDGQNHWVYGSSVTSKIQCVSVKGSVANLRKGPGGSFPLADYGKVHRFYAFKRLDRKGDWYKVVDNFGVEGWLHESVIWKPLRVNKFSF